MSAFDFLTHEQATAAYAAAVRLRREMEFQRPIEKGAAIKRVMDAGQATSATAAEKLVESEPEYAKFCAALTDAVIAEITAREALCVARLRAGMPAFVEHDR